MNKIGGISAAATTRARALNLIKTKSSGGGPGSGDGGTSSSSSNGSISGSSENSGGNSNPGAVAGAGIDPDLRNRSTNRDIDGGKHRVGMLENDDDTQEGGGYANLWDGLDPCLEHAWAAKLSCKKLATILQEWSKAEEQNARTLPGVKKKFQVPENEFGTLALAWQEFGNSFEKIGEGRLKLAGIIGALGGQLHAFRRDQTKIKRKLQLEGQKLRKDLATQEAMFVRAKQRYEKACKDAEHAIALKEKAHQEKSLQDISKLWQRTMEAVLLVQETENQYKSAIDDMRSAKAKYNVAMRRLLQDLQILEENRVEHLKEMMERAVRAQREWSEAFREMTESVQETVSKVDYCQDIAEFVRRNMKPPESEIVFEKSTNEKVEEELKRLMGQGPKNSIMYSMTANSPSYNNTLIPTNPGGDPSIPMMMTMPPPPPMTPMAGGVPPPPPPSTAIHSNLSSMVIPPPRPSVSDSGPTLSSLSSSSSYTPSDPSGRVRGVPRRSSIGTAAELSPDHRMKRPKSPVRDDVQPMRLSEFNSKLSHLEMNRDGTATSASNTGMAQTGPPSSPVPPPPIRNDNATDPKYVRVIYDYQKQDANELQLIAGEVIQVLEVDASGWWEGKSRDGREGMFPANYTEPISVQEALSSGSFSSEPSSAPVEKRGNDHGVPLGDFSGVSSQPESLFSEKPPSEKVIVVFDYQAQDASDLTVRKAQVLHVHGIDRDGGWLDASDTTTGKRGMVPSNYVRAIQSAQTA